MKRLVACVLALMAFSAVAEAASMKWNFRAFHNNIVDVKLWSKSRNNVWPSSSTVWSIKNYNVMSVNITCVDGERICYGGWVRGSGGKTYWGVGSNGKAGCSNCCYTCGNTSTPVINLNAR